MIRRRFRETVIRSDQEGVVDRTNLFNCISRNNRDFTGIWGDFFFGFIAISIERSCGKIGIIESSHKVLIVGYSIIDKVNVSWR